MEKFSDYVERRDAEVNEAIAPYIRAGIAGPGNFGLQLARGAANVGTGLTRALGGSAIGSLGALGQAVTSDPALGDFGAKHAFGGAKQAWKGAAQIAGSPISAFMRARQAAKQKKLGIPTGGKAAEMFGLAPSVTDDPEQGKGFWLGSKDVRSSGKKRKVSRGAEDFANLMQGNEFA